ncbi:MAG TPA: hypothetical protein VGU01_05385 [Sphingomicrobium sp.]|nr:hypothetical protein [Sphingomicrobium sp.]
MTEHALANVLLAQGPNHDHAAELQLFGQFEGAWGLDVTWFRNGELVREERGEWHFGWILDGRAMQDVWIVPTKAEQETGAQPYECGTSVRFFDPDLKAWRSTWIGPVQGSVRPFLAERRGDEIVLSGQQLDGREIEWVFLNIGPDSFSWRFRKRSESGTDWEVVQAFECRRRK